MTRTLFSQQPSGGFTAQPLLWSVILVLALATPLYAEAPTATDSSAAPPASAGSAASPASPPPAAPDTSARQPALRYSSVTPEAAAPPPMPLLPPPTGILSAEDAPNDAGKAILVTWRPQSAPDDLTGYRLRAEQLKPAAGKANEEKPATPYVFEHSWPANQEEYRIVIEKLVPGVAVNVSVQAVAGDRYSEPSPVQIAVPKGNWFHTGKIPVGLALAVFIGFLLIFVQKSRSGAKLFVRKIAGLEAVEDAVGRATEMGRSILYVPGLSSISDVATIASLSILAPVARKAATYATKLIVPNRDPIVFTVAREVVKTSFNQVGRPDLYDDNSVFFITDSQFGFAAAVDGIIVRERPATNFFLGMFWAESLVMAETGAATGAIQIAGTDAVNQIPFFIVSCDYTLMGEELYAASAYLGTEPILLGTLKAQDAVKLLILGVIILGVVTSLVGSTALFDILRPPQ